MSAITEQYEYEIKSWIKTLDHIEHELQHMKNRLNGITRKNVQDQRIGQYWNTLLNKEATIRFLRMDIHEFLEYKTRPEQFHNRLKELKGDMAMMEQQFIHLKSGFNNFMQEISGQIS